MRLCQTLTDMPVHPRTGHPLDPAVFKSFAQRTCRRDPEFFFTDTENLFGVRTGIGAYTRQFRTGLQA
jgi:hypothetical protein